MSVYRSTNPADLDDVVAEIELGDAESFVTAAAAARKAGVDVTYDYRSGLHAWGYWAQDLHRSWPTVVTALGLPPVDPADYR